MELFEVRWHGRGGQGAWTASQLLALAAIREGAYAQSFPEFGPERGGAPIQAFTRISSKPIRIHSNVYTPDAVVVLDPTLLKSINVAAGVKKDGVLVINFEEAYEDLIKKLKERTGLEIWVVKATKIAVSELGTGITNTAMLGALLKARGLVKLDTVFSVVKERFKGEVAEKNLRVISRAYEEVKKFG